MTDLMIVGGGAAGLMAAICFLEECPQGKVKLLEAGERVGKKLLSTGNGRCNLTNLRAAARDYAPCGRFRRAESAAAAAPDRKDGGDGPALPGGRRREGLPCVGRGLFRAGYPAADGGTLRRGGSYRL